MKLIEERKSLTYSKKLPKEYLILNLRMIFNKELYENKIISFEIFNRMEEYLIRKMDEVILSLKE